MCRVMSVLCVAIAGIVVAQAKRTSFPGPEQVSCWLVGWFDEVEDAARRQRTAAVAVAVAVLST